MFDVLYTIVDKETKKTNYFLIKVKGKNVTWISLTEEQYAAMKTTTQEIK